MWSCLLLKNIRFWCLGRSLGSSMNLRKAEEQAAIVAEFSIPQLICALSNLRDELSRKGNLLPRRFCYGRVWLYFATILFLSKQLCPFKCNLLKLQQSSPFHLPSQQCTVFDENNVWCNTIHNFYIMACKPTQHLSPMPFSLCVS